jgi:hypothetical protein
MVIVLAAFAVVFFYRDTHALAAVDRKQLMARFACYAVLLLAAGAIMAGSVQVPRAIHFAWTRKRCALAAVSVQLVELAIALLLRKLRGGRHGWIGCILPCPAFLAGLSALTFAVQGRFSGLGAVAASEIVTGCWLALVAALALPLSAREDSSADRTFVGDFALMTSCTALIFVPYGFF